MKPKCTSILLALAVVLAGSTAVMAAPAQLFGKSIIVKWTENRIQRNVGESEFRSVNASHELSVYVSSTGRVFNKLQNTTRRGSGSNEQVAGQGDSNRIASFSGRTMTFVQPQQGMARRIAAEFDEGFTSCTATVIRGKESGAGSGFSKSLITGLRIETKSVTTSGVSCSVRAGNVFE